MSNATEIKEEDYKYVLAMDPGGTTGIAMLRYTDETAPELIYLHQQEKGLAGFYDFFHGTQPNEQVTIVSESFTIREGVHGADVTPLRIEGAQYVYWGDEVVYQDPAMKSMVKDEWLKSQNLWTPGKRHQMDALIHAFVYLRNEMHTPTLKSMSGDAEKPIAEPGEAQNAQLTEDELDQKDLAQAAVEIEKAWDAFDQMFGGERDEQAEEEQSKAEQAQAKGRPQPGEGTEGGEGEAEGEAQGEAGEGESDGEPTGGGGRGKEFEVDYTDILGGTRKRQLNGAFTGYHDDDE